MSLSGDNDLAERPIDYRKKEIAVNQEVTFAPSGQDDFINESTSLDWGNLPHVVLVSIFESLDETTLLRAQFTCKRWYDVIHHSASLWRDKSFRFSGRDPRDLTHAPYKFATQFTKCFGKYLQTLEFKLFSPVSSSVCKKFQKCVKVCFNNLVKNKAKLVELSIPGLQLDRSQWMLYREDFCSILAAFFCRGQHTIEALRLEGARTCFEDGYKVLYAMGYNTGATIAYLNIEDMFVSRRPIYDVSQFVGCFKYFPRLESLIMNYSYLSEELLETLASTLHCNCLKQLFLKVTQHDPHHQVIWGHSWSALTKQCPELRVEILFQRVVTFDDHFRILLPQIPLSEVMVDGCYVADRDWQIQPTISSILPHFKQTLRRLCIELPDTREVFENELLTLVEHCKKLWYLKMSAFVSTRFLDRLLQLRSEGRCSLSVIKLRIYVRDYDTEAEDQDLDRIFDKYRHLITNELKDYYANCCISI